MDVGLQDVEFSEAVLVEALFEELWRRSVTVVANSNYSPEQLYAPGNLNREGFSQWCILTREVSLIAEHYTWEATSSHLVVACVL